MIVQLVGFRLEHDTSAAGSIIENKAAILGSLPETCSIARSNRFGATIRPSSERT